MKVNPADAESIDSIISLSYELISGRAGEKRDWERMRTLFIPDARLIPTNRKLGARHGEGELPLVLDFEAYMGRVREYFETNDFYEVEIARRTEQFDRIAHVFSTYESRNRRDEGRPFMRGINSIQLFNDGRRWWIVTIFWQQEHADQPIPSQYLP